MQVTHKQQPEAARFFFNLLGFLPQGPKTIVTTHSEASPFSVLNAETGSVCYTGVLEASPLDPITGIASSKADFSELTVPGTYRLSVGTDLSPVFTIAEHSYDALTRDLLKMFYFQRCGCDLTEKHAGVFTHPACHTALALPYGEDPATAAYVDVHGGWHDAGDYGRYVTPGALTVSHFLYAYEIFPEKFDFTVNIPESGNGTPDVLNEARYELDWLLRMQLPDGRVYHKVTTANHAPFLMPQDDREPLYLYPPSTISAAMFVAVTMQAARIFRAFDEDYSKKLFEAGMTSLRYLLEHPEFIPFRNPKDCRTGEYGHPTDRDSRLWASTEFLRTLATGAFDALLPADISRVKEQVYARFYGYVCDFTVKKDSFGWHQVGGLALLAVCFCPDADAVFGEKMVEMAKRFLLFTADSVLKLRNESSFNIPLKREDYTWGSSLGLMNRAMFCIAAHLLTGNESYRTCAFDCLDYLLGRNTLQFSYVSGHGSNCLKDPHNRPTVADGIEEMIPGFVAGGANCLFHDPTAKKLLPELGKVAPMDCYIDDHDCFSLNEIAIYWNSTALFVAAYLM
ncbi:MAG: glycoside hydrolase family 9 protein [Lachnospiraceae bacterium]|nr:glycoside hydrolase family 9 protein [Lachnospiraceae bacterium]